jgi:hypothetical protein
MNIDNFMWYNLIFSNNSYKYIYVASATASVAKTHLMNENESTNPSPEADLDDFWHTSMGKFRFTIEELPEQLQYIHKLLKVLYILLRASAIKKFLKKIKNLLFAGDNDN